MSDTIADVRDSQHGPAKPGARSHSLAALTRTFGAFGRLDTIFSALVRWRLAIGLLEKLTYRQIDQIGPTIERSMLARWDNNQLPTR